MKKPTSVSALTELGRIQLSKSFFMRDFLFSDIAAIHGLSNVPDDPDLAIQAGRSLCEELLEPLQDVFGRVTIRSAYRSRKVNGLGNKMMRNGKNSYNCASNDANAAHHIWTCETPRVAWERLHASLCPASGIVFKRRGTGRKLHGGFMITCPIPPFNSSRAIGLSTSTDTRDRCAGLTVSLHRKGV